MSSASRVAMTRGELVGTVVGFVALGAAVLASLGRGGVVAIAAMGCTAQGYSCGSPLITAGILLAQNGPLVLGVLAAVGAVLVRSRGRRTAWIPWTALLLSLVVFVAAWFVVGAGVVRDG